LLKKQTLLSMAMISTLALLFNANAMEQQNDEVFQCRHPSRLFELLPCDPRDAEQVNEIVQHVEVIWTELGGASALSKPSPYWIAYNGPQPVKNPSPEWVKYGTLLVKFTLARYLEESVDVQHVEKLAKSTNFHLALARAGFGASLSEATLDAMEERLRFSSFFGVLCRPEWSLGLEELSDDQKKEMKENLGKIFDGFGASNIQDTMSILTPFTRGMSPEQRLGIVSDLAKLMEKKSARNSICTDFFYQLKKEYTNGHYKESKFNGKLVSYDPTNRFIWLEDWLITQRWKYDKSPR